MSMGVRMRMLIRLLGITAVLAAGAGAIYLSSVLPDWKQECVVKALRNELGGPAMVGSTLLFGGAFIALIAFIVEVLSSLTGGSRVRGTAGINAGGQVVLAIALVVAVNTYAFLHEADFDLTSNKQFTLPGTIVSELQKLKSETTIVVLQQHKTFGRLSDKPDRFDYAAERKVVEKVQDTVDLFRKFGPQFKVVVLDVEEENYDKKLDKLTKDNAALRTAIQTAPENSIFFASEGKVQRMSFNEFYQLDKHASKTDGNNRGNLVLYPQGIETLVRRITAIEEKRPKVAIAVTHPLLSTQKKKGSGAEDFTLAGLKKSLNDYGIDVVDVVLKKNYRGDYEGDPASYTVQETRLIELEDKLESAKDDFRREKAFGERLGRNLKKIEEAKKKDIAGRLDLYLSAFSEMSRRRVLLSPADRLDERVQKEFEEFILRQFDFWEKEHKQDLLDAETELKQIETELQETSKNERAIEDRYLTDVKAKFTRLLSDCDMLIIPRLTIMNAATGFVLPRNLHKLDKTQADIIKDFMKAGKPVMVCAGPVNVPFDTPLPPAFDDVEALLNDRGIVLAKQTILFNVESKSFRESTSEEDELSDNTVDVPPLRFVPPEEFKQNKRNSNPIAISMAVLANSVDQSLDVSVRAPRPIYLNENFKDDLEKEQGFSGEFLWTNARSWNERYPFNFMFKTQVNPFNMQPQRTRARMPPPRYDAPSGEGKQDIPKGDEERRGPFSLGVAIESTLPQTWYTDAEWKKMKAIPKSERVKSRLVVIGHGALFNRAELSPSTEKLALVTCNWLLHREDRLPHTASEEAPNSLDRPWKYPRVEMSDGQKSLWHWATFLGLPAVFVYLGLIVLMLRRVR